MNYKGQLLKLVFFALIYVGIILSIWLLLNYYKESNTFILEMSKLSYSNIMVESLAITGAVLSLMGLIAIFISLNTQHNIQRCRQLYWEMVDTKNKFKLDIVSRANELRRLINNYSVAFSPGTNFIGKIILIAQVTIWFVIVTWTIIFVLSYWPKNSLLELNFNSVSFLIILSFANSILYYFASIIKDLNSIKKVDDNLQEPDEFYDVENKYRVPIIPLIANELEFSVRLDEVQSKGNVFNINLELEHANPINNFDVVIRKIRLDFFDYMNPTRGDILLEEKLDVTLTIKNNSKKPKNNLQFSDSLSYVINFNKYRGKPLTIYRNFTDLNYKFILLGYVQPKGSTDFNERVFFTLDNLVILGLNTKMSSKVSSKLISYKEWEIEHNMNNLKSNHSKYDDDFEESILE